MPPSWAAIVRRMRLAKRGEPQRRPAEMCQGHIRQPLSHGAQGLEGGLRALMRSRPGSAAGEAPWIVRPYCVC